MYNPSTKKPLGGNSIVPDAWGSASKEDALHFQRKGSERIAYHQMGTRKNGQPSRSINFHICSVNEPSASNVPLFPDSEAAMAFGRPGEGQYVVRAVLPQGEEDEDRKGKMLTWCQLGITPELLRIGPPGFVHFPAQSSKTEHVPSLSGSDSQFNERMVLRSLTGALDVPQGAPVAKRFERMDKLYSEEVMADIGVLNHPSP